MPEDFGQPFLRLLFYYHKKGTVFSLKLRFLQDEIPDYTYQNAKVVILPIPFERTTSFGKGTINGPKAVLLASPYLETFDEELHVEPFEVGLFTHQPLKFVGSFDQDFDLITSSVIQLLDDQKFVISIGGEHSVSFPLYRAFHQKYANLSVLQLDAHADLRHQYQGTQYSHACVMRRIYSLNEQIVQLGIRALSKEEYDFIMENNSIKTFFAYQMYEQWPEDALNYLSDNVYLTIDVDFFDPAFLPATGTPEPGGFFWPETIAFLKKIFSKKNVVGVDIVELSPQTGTNHSQFTVAKLIYKLIAYKFFLNR